MYELTLWQDAEVLGRHARRRVVLDHAHEAVHRHAKVVVAFAGDERSSLYLLFVTEPVSSSAFYQDAIMLPPSGERGRYRVGRKKLMRYFCVRESVCHCLPPR